ALLVVGAAGDPVERHRQARRDRDIRLRGALLGIAVALRLLAGIIGVVVGVVLAGDASLGPAGQERVVSAIHFVGLGIAVNRRRDGAGVAVATVHPQQPREHQRDWVPARLRPLRQDLHAVGLIGIG